MEVLVVDQRVAVFIELDQDLLPDLGLRSSAGTTLSEVFILVKCFHFIRIDVTIAVRVELVEEVFDLFLALGEEVLRAG